MQRASAEEKEEVTEDVRKEAEEGDGGEEDDG